MDGKFILNTQKIGVRRGQNRRTLMMVLPLAPSSQASCNTKMEVYRYYAAVKTGPSIKAGVMTREKRGRQ